MLSYILNERKALIPGITNLTSLFKKYHGVFVTKKVNFVGLIKHIPFVHYDKMKTIKHILNLAKEKLKINIRKYIHFLFLMSC